MRLTVLALAFACTLPAVAQTAGGEDPVLQLALEAVPHHLLSAPHPKLANVRKTQFAVADATIAGAESSFSDFVHHWHGREIGGELLASYRANSGASQHIGATDAAGIPVLSLEAFSSGGTSYDWERLSVKHPDVKAVVRVSRPALDRLASYAVVRYEVIVRTGPVWATLEEFVKQPDGSWEAKHSRIGNLWK